MCFAMFSIVATISSIIARCIELFPSDYTAKQNKTDVTTITSIIASCPYPQFHAPNGTLIPLMVQNSIWTSIKILGIYFSLLLLKNYLLQDLFGMISMI